MGSSLKKCKQLEYFSKKSREVKNKAESKQNIKAKKNSNPTETNNKKSAQKKGQEFDEGAASNNASSVKSLDSELSEENLISRGVNDDDYFSKDEIEYYDRQFGNHNNNNGTISIMSRNSLRPKKIRFKEAEILGHGSFGRVYLGLNCDNGELMAVKQVQITGFNNSQEKMDQLEAEIEILSQLRHKNIVGYIGTSKTNNSFNIFLEYAAGGSIASMLDKYGKFEESLIRIYTKHVLCGLEYLHWNKVIHRDIKGGNVLVDKNGVCKLADFGSAKKTCGLYEKEKLASLKGTLNWMAPEVITQKGHGRFADIWSIGCLIVEMATGRPPWSNCKNPIDTMLAIAKCSQPPPYPANLSPEAIDFLNKCFKKIPQQRANITKLLRHNFVTGQSQLFKEPKNLTSIPEELFILMDKASPKKIETKELLGLGPYKDERPDNRENFEKNNPKGLSKSKRSSFVGDKNGKRTIKEDYLVMNKLSSQRQIIMKQESSKDIEASRKDASSTMNRKQTVIKNFEEGTPSREISDSKIFKSELNSEGERSRMEGSASKNEKRERSKSSHSNRGVNILIFENSDAGESSISSDLNNNNLMKASRNTNNSSPKGRVAGEKYYSFSGSNCKNEPKNEIDDSKMNSISNNKKTNKNILIELPKSSSPSSKALNNSTNLIDHVCVKVEPEDFKNTNITPSNNDKGFIVPSVKRNTFMISKAENNQKPCKDSTIKPFDVNMTSSSDSSGNKTGNQTFNSGQQQTGSALRGVYKTQQSSKNNKATNNSNKSELKAVSLNSSNVNERLDAVSGGSRLANESRLNKNHCLPHCHNHNENDINMGNKSAQEMIFLRKWSPAAKHLVPLRKFPNKVETDEMEAKGFEKNKDVVDGHLKFLSMNEIKHHEVDVV